jgi:hypothetical protein
MKFKLTFFIAELTLIGLPNMANPQPNLQPETQQTNSN